VVTQYILIETLSTKNKLISFVVKSEDHINK